MLHLPSISPVQLQRPQAETETEMRRIFEDIPAAQYLLASVTDEFGVSGATANRSSRGLAYSPKKDPRHGPLFTLQSRFAVSARTARPALRGS
jgi:hypothetical protein